MNDEFYSSAKWRKKAQHIMRRDGYQCQLCKRYGRITQAELVHHKIEIEDDPSLAFEDSNLVAICRACHNKVHEDKGAKANRRRSSKYNINDPYGGM